MDRNGDNGNGNGLTTMVRGSSKRHRQSGRFLFVVCLLLLLLEDEAVAANKKQWAFFADIILLNLLLIRFESRNNSNH